MKDMPCFDVVIIGGSYAGLSAGMALGRALRKVLIVDSGKSCNQQTPYSHNFITQDGEKPEVIAKIAKEQVLKYDTVHFAQDVVVCIQRVSEGFNVITKSKKTFCAKKIILATGIKDYMPSIPGFSECWGISVIHCPYCHGYEVKNQKTGILANGDTAFEMCKMIDNWTSDITLFTNGKSTLSEQQKNKLQEKKILIVEKQIEKINHFQGKLKSITYIDREEYGLDVMYARIPFEHHTNIAQELLCDFTEQGLIKTDSMQKTSQIGVYACGDNSTMMRSVSNAVFTGSIAGIASNKELIEEDF